ncbi:D-aminoacyl-tRNA deacylase 2-like [Diadema antillarum]|uniref:D-aminoacyl-tRNA deacylase 2-like n=1 Tax=Diadema antillarum TaxID=105358 RepID=UPI003A8B71FB
MANQPNSEFKARLVIQQCLSAKLQVQPASSDNEAVFVEINSGIILFVCFLRGADRDTVQKMVKSALNIRLSKLASSKRVSVLNLPGDVLVVPQSTLGGKANGKMVQYHSNIDKESGAELFRMFVELCACGLASNDRTLEAGCKVLSGNYGSRHEVLSMNTYVYGPLTHIIDF